MGFQAFMSGDFDACIEHLGGLLKYIATDQMLLAVLISLRRGKDEQALIKFSNECFEISKDDPCATLMYATVLDLVDQDLALTLVQGDDATHCRYRYCLGIRFMAEGKVQAAMDSFRACLQIGADDFSSEAAKGEIQRHEGASLNMEAWLEDLRWLVGKVGTCMAEGSSKDAWQAASRTVEVLRRRPALIPIDLAPSLRKVADFFAAHQQWDQAYQVLKRIEDVLRNASGGPHADLEKVLGNLGFLLAKLGRPVDAEEYLTQAIAASREGAGTPDPELAIHFDLLGSLCLGGGRYGESEKHFRKSLELNERAFGRKNEKYARILQQLGPVFLGTGRPQEAIACLSEALAIRRGLDGDGEKIAWILNDLGNAHGAALDIAAAMSSYQEALEVYQAVSGEKSIGFATTLGNLAMAMEASKRHSEAIGLLEQSYRLKTECMSDEEPSLLETAIDLAHAWATAGDRRKARELFESTMGGIRRAKASLDAQLVAKLPLAGRFFQEEGEFANAEELYRMVMDHFGDEETLARSRTAYITSVLNLAGLCITISRLDEGFELGMLAFRMVSKTDEKQRDLLGSVLNTLGEAFRAAHDYDKAIGLFEHALRAGGDRVFTATVMNNMALAHHSKGDFPQAASLFESAIEIDKEVLGTQSLGYAIDLHNLGELRAAMGLPGEAMQLYRQALEIHRSNLGEYGPFLPRWLGDLAAVEAMNGLPDSALASLREAMSLDDRILWEVFSISVESKRVAFLKVVNNRYHLFLALAFSESDRTPSLEKTVYETVLRRKSLVFEASYVQTNRLQAGNHTDLQFPIKKWLGNAYPMLGEKYAQWVSIGEKIGHLELEGSGQQDPAAYKENLNALYRSKNELEALLANSTLGSDFRQRLRDLTIEKLLAHLPGASALVEFVRINPSAQDQFQRQSPLFAEHYVAFVLRQDSSSGPVAVKIGEVAGLERLIAEFRREVSKPVASGIRGKGSASARLRAAVFDKLLPAIEGCTHLFIVPDGDLNLVPFETLRMADGGYLGDRFPTSYLGCGRDLLRFKDVPRSEPSDPVIIADPAFDLQAEASLPSTPVPDGYISPSMEDRGKMGFEQAIRFSPLGHTRSEGEKIAALLGVAPWLGGDALETRLKSARSPRILHIATHGFFLREGHGVPPRMGNPLLRSGLVLAGANTWLAGGSVTADAQDGLLTAQDVVGLHLSATELVVLSACETGLGVIRSGEGVYGLRRAFLLAGARTLVMSLWKVPDEQTKELMIEFYSRLLAGAPVAEALRRSQQNLRVRYPDPFYWGAFICQGNPGPLQAQATSIPSEISTRLAE